MKKQPHGKYSPSTLLLAALFCTLPGLAVVSYQALSHPKQKASSTPAPLSTYSHTGTDADFSFQYPATYKASSPSDPSVDGIVAVALSSDPSYTFPTTSTSKICTADYLVMSQPDNQSSQDVRASLEALYFENPAVQSITIQGHEGFIVSGITSPHLLSSAYAPLSAKMFMAVLENGNDRVSLATCSSQPNEREFNQIIGSLSLKGTRTQPTSTPIAVLGKQSTLRSRDAQRGGDLTFLT